MEEMLKKNAAIQRETNKAKLLALQTQINPHFLANSFETIRTDEERLRVKEFIEQLEAQRKKPQ